MRYIETGGNHCQFLIYCINPERDRWKIEPYPVNGEVMEVSGDYVDRLIRLCKLKEVEE